MAWVGDRSLRTGFASSASRHQHLLRDRPRTTSWSRGPHQHGRSRPGQAGAGDSEGGGGGGGERNEELRLGPLNNCYVEVNPIEFDR